MIKIFAGDDQTNLDQNSADKIKDLSTGKFINLKVPKGADGDQVQVRPSMGPYKDG